MSFVGKKFLLVGDNPFHGISHISDDRARARGAEINNSIYAAKLVKTSLDNGASGFMFSVSDTTLSILRLLTEGASSRSPTLYAIVPYAYEYVRIATNLGTVGLAKKLTKQMVLSGNVGAIGASLKFLATMNPKDLLKAYLLYELSRTKDAIGTRFILESMMLHEVITEIILSLNLDWLAKSYIDLSLELGMKPGFETRNFAYLVKKFNEWAIDFSKISIATPFNRLGFQMNPSRKDCEKALMEVSECNLIAMSSLASGYLTLSEAADYLENLPSIKGVVIGVSREKQALETFKYMKEKLG